MPRINQAGRDIVPGGETPLLTAGERWNHQRWSWTAVKWCSETSSIASAAEKYVILDVPNI